MTDPLTRERKALLKRLEAEDPRDPDRVQRRLLAWEHEQEVRADNRARAEADEALGEPDEDELIPYLATYVSRDVALQEWRRDRRQTMGAPRFAGSQASRVAPLRERPSGSPGGWA